MAGFKTGPLIPVYQQRGALSTLPKPSDFCFRTYKVSPHPESNWRSPDRKLDFVSIWTKPRASFDQNNLPPFYGHEGVTLKLHRKTPIAEIAQESGAQVEWHASKNIVRATPAPAEERRFAR